MVCLNVRRKGNELPERRNFSFDLRDVKRIVSEFEEQTRRLCGNKNSVLMNADCVDNENDESNKADTNIMRIVQGIIFLCGQGWFNFKVIFIWRAPLTNKRLSLSEEKK